MPEDLSFDRKTLTAEGKRIDLVYRRVLINDILARPDECAALVSAYAGARGVRRQARSGASWRTRKRSSRC